LVAGLAFGLVAGPIFGLSAGPASGGESSRPPHWSRFRLPGGLAPRLLLGLYDEGAMPDGDTRPAAQTARVAVLFGLTAGLTSGLAGGLVAGLTFGLYTAIAVGLGCGLSSIIADSFSGGLAGRIVPTEQMRWSWSKLPRRARPVR
jgi:hypothetical protein